jgi:hypothetical protein
VNLAVSQWLPKSTLPHLDDIDLGWCFDRDTGVGSFLGQIASSSDTMSRKTISKVMGVVQRSCTLRGRVVKRPCLVSRMIGHRRVVGVV